MIRSLLRRTGQRKEVLLSGRLRSYVSSNALQNCLTARELPAFEQIKLSDFAPVVEKLTHTTRDSLKNYEQHFQTNRNDPVSWEKVVHPLEEMTDDLTRAWMLISHLLSVQNSPELRAIHEKLQPAVISTYMACAQSQVTFDCFSKLRNTPEIWQSLNEPQQRIVEKMIRDMTHSGIGLEGEERQRLNDLIQKSATLAAQFSNNVLDATKSFSILVSDKKEMDGLPDSVLQSTAQSAKEDGNEHATPESGPWKLTLDMPCLLPVLKYSSNRDLRERMYKANLHRASELTNDSKYDNTELINETLRLRKEQAQLLGFNTFAELSLSSKMAENVEVVEEMHEKLRKKAIVIAKKEFEEMKQYAEKQGQKEPLAQWDFTYWSEKRRAELFTFTDEMIKPYFPLPKVLDGLFNLSSDLFGITIEENRDSIQVWHEDVKFYDIYDLDEQKQKSKKIASFYLDLYARPSEKNGGAWMNGCLSRSTLLTKDGSTRLPVAYLICNQSRPVGDQPSLMTFREVETLFHEFGHGLQHMLTTVDYEGAAGINNVEWDAVELPSQFMENFCYHKDTINAISGHVDTGEPLPDNLFEQICASRKFLAASTLLRQLNFATLDLYLYHQYDPFNSERSIYDVQKEIAKKNAVMAPLETDRFLCSFSHIFAGGYAAGYYSYKWAEVLSCDAFAAFEEENALNNKKKLLETGKRFRDTVLASGGGRHPLKVYEDFRGRQQDISAFLRLYGLDD